MRIEVNGKLVETAAANLDQLVREYVPADIKVATALNGSFVPLTSRVSTSLKAGDKIEIVSPRQGG